MPFFTLPKKLVPGYSTNKKPTIPVVIDWSNPLTKGLKSFIVYGHGAPFDLVQNSLPTTTFNSPKMFPQYTEFTGDRYYYENLQDVALNGLSVITKTRVNSITNSYITNTINDSDIGISLNTGSGGQFRLNWNNSDWNTVESSSGVVLGEWRTYGGTVNANGDVSSGKLYVDSEVTVNTTSGSGGLPTLGYQLDVGGRSTTGRDLTGDIEYVAVFGVELTPKEFNSFRFNPYQILKPAIDTVYFTADAGGTVDDLLANDVESDSELTVPSVGQKHLLTSVSIESNSEVSAPSLTQKHALLVISVESASEVSNPSVVDVGATVDPLTADDVESASEVSVPTIGQEHSLLVTNVESLSEVTVPLVGQKHILASVSIESTSEVSTPILGQAHVLSSISVESSSELTAPTLADIADTVDQLYANSIESLSEVSNPVIGQVHVITATSVESFSELSIPVLGGVVDLETMVKEIWQLLGLDKLNPTTTTQTSADVDTIHQDITGDGVNTSTITRND